MHAFIKAPSAGKDGIPNKVLIGFETVYLEPGKSTEILFYVTPLDFTYFDSDGKR